VYNNCDYRSINHGPRREEVTDEKEAKSRCKMPELQWMGLVGDNGSTCLKKMEGRMNSVSGYALPGAFRLQFALTKHSRWRKRRRREWRKSGGNNKEYPGGM
jgi:hypothetical protein